jgi:hypothetical protein
LECIEEILQRQRKGTWEEGENERVMGKWIWSKYITHINENVIMRPIVLYI